MVVLFCVLLVVILFLIFMEVITYPNNVRYVNDTYQASHIVHMITYIIAFIVCAFLLLCKLNM